MTIIASNGFNSPEISSRIQKFKLAFGTFSPFFSPGRLTLQWKREVFKAACWNVLLFDLERRYVFPGEILLLDRVTARYGRKLLGFPGHGKLSSCHYTVGGKDGDWVRQMLQILPLRGELA